MPGLRSPLLPRNPVGLVTGASTGIGLAIARQLSERPDARFFYLLRRLLPRRVYHAVLHRALPRAREWGSETSAPESGADA
jgi:NAD(P)-dependent dehydrogenase (short-subunit alcohol dehydrogenase family)